MKKQLIRMLLAIAVVISAVTIGTKTAKAATQGDWEYTVDENLQAKITAYYWNAPEMKGKSSDGFKNIIIYCRMCNYYNNSGSCISNYRS